MRDGGAKLQSTLANPEKTVRRCNEKPGMGVVYMCARLHWLLALSVSPPSPSSMSRCKRGRIGRLGDMETLPVERSY